MELTAKVDWKIQKYDGEYEEGVDPIDIVDGTATFEILTAFEISDFLQQLGIEQDPEPCP